MSADAWPDKAAVERALASWFGPSWLGRPSEDDTLDMTAALNAALSLELKALIEAINLARSPGEDTMTNPANYLSDYEALAPLVAHYEAHRDFITRAPAHAVVRGPALTPGQWKDLVALARRAHLAEEEAALAQMAEPLDVDQAASASS